MKINAKLAEALVNLRGNRDFAVCLEALSEHESEELNRCVEAEATILHRAQGAVKVLRFWKDAFRDAPTILDKLKQQQQQQRGQNTP